MRPIVTSITGLTASATDVSASQSVPGANGVVLDGTLTAGYSATAIATTTSNGAGTTTVTLNGARVASDGFAYIDPPAQIVLVSAGNDVARTWAVRGMTEDGRAAQAETIQAANTSRTATTKLFSKVTSVVLSGTSAGNVSVGVNGRATITQPRRISLVSGGADTGITFAVTGTDVNGATIAETVTGGASTATWTVLSYKGLTKIVASAATASTLTVGTAADSIAGGAAHSRWVFMDSWAPSTIAIQVNVSGTANYTIQQSLDDPNDPTNAVAVASMAWVNHPDVNLVGVTGVAQGNYAYNPKWARILLTSGTGTVTATFSQANVVSL